MADSLSHPGMAFEPAKEDFKKGPPPMEEEEGGVWSSLKKTLVLLTTSTVVLLAMRNTITYHLQHFWGASGDFWQHQWDKILDLCDHNEFNLVVFGPTLVSYCIYWTYGTVFTIFDMTNLPAFLRPYKIQPGTNEPVALRLVVKTFLSVSFNQLVSGTAFSALCYYLMTLRGFDRSPHLPTFHWVLFELAFSVLMVEFGFYYAHRLFHHKSLYKHVHKIHHEWQSPIAIAALDVHPLEYTLANLGPVILGPLLLGSHVATLWLWTCMATLNTLNAHCGYHLPCFPSNEAHDYHHLKFNQCYGVLGILDHLHGTDDKFRASRNYARHTTSLSLIPLREKYPDVDPNAKTIKGKQC